MQTKHPATYQDVLDAPEHLVAELLDGELFLSPRPGGPHTLVASYLGGELLPPFSRGRGGPGGWVILDEPELHLTHSRVCVPDLAGWRRERMATVPDDHKFTTRPDWVCEVASKSTEKLDRSKKLPAYAQAGVGHAWLIHPGYRTLEVLRLVDGKWMVIDVFADDEVVRAEPFEAIELDLGGLWKELPVRASEGYVQYGEAPY
jgi:Uma2 family endonuclease